MKVLKMLLRYPLECISGVFFFIMAIVVFFQVIVRVFSIAVFPWPEELARFLFVWASFLGAVVAIKAGSHYRVDFFIDFLPKKVKAIYTIVVDIVLCILVAYWGAQGIRALKGSSIQQLPALMISMGWLYAAIPVCCGFMLIVLIIKIFRDMKELNVSSKGLDPTPN